MSYTNTWAALRDISGSTTPANQIDDKFRDRMNGLQERLETELIQDCEADPWVVQDALKGKVTGKVLVIPHSAFIELASVGDLTLAFGSNSMGWVNGDGVMQAAVMLPPGVTVTLVEFLINNGSGTFNWRFFKHAFSTSSHTETNIATGTSATTGDQIVSSGVLAEVIDGGQIYQISCHNTGVTPSVAVFGARITYNTPSSQQTI